MAEPKKLAIIATKGTLDMAYPPLILATTAAALDYEVTIFWTFYGLKVLRKERDLRISRMGNPAMPVILPGMKKEVPIPMFMDLIPGMEFIATKMMKSRFEQKGVASIDDLMEIAIESEVHMIACQMTVDLFDYKHSDMIDGVEYAGAARFFEIAGEADVSLFI